MSDDEGRKDYLNMSGGGDGEQLPPPPPPRPTRQQRHLPAAAIAAVLVAVVVVLAGARFLGLIGGSANTPAASPTATRPTVTASSSSAAQVPTSSDTSTQNPVPGASEVEHVATVFVAALLKQGQSREAWAANVKPYCTTQFAPRLMLTNPANIPAQSVNGPARITGSNPSGQKPTTVYVPTTKGGYTVVVVQPGDGTAKVDVAQPGQPPEGD